MNIIGQNVILREYYYSDWERVHIYASEPSFTEYEAWGPNTINDTKLFISDMLIIQAKKPRYEFELAIIDKQTNLLVGGCGLRKSEVDDSIGNVGYAVSPEFQGKGIATEATNLLLDLAFGSLGIKTVYASCDTSNIASYSVMKKCGMKKVNVFKDKRDFKGRISDEFKFEITCDEYLLLI